jgi:hypothetical protein
MMRGPPGPPMSLANMRQNGVRAVVATCESCNRSADVNVDAMPETVYVPHVGRRLRCSQCNGKAISTRPAWHTGRRSMGPLEHARDVGDLKAGDRHSPQIKFVMRT